VWLILQIALGILLGYILIENRNRILKAAGGLAVLTVVTVLGGLAIFAVIHVGGSTIDAIRDYGAADWIGKKIFFCLGMIVYLCLAVSMLFGIWFAVISLMPASFIRFCERKGRPHLTGTLSVLLTAGVLLASSNISLPGILSRWEAAWTDWGLAHGMGYDGRSTFDLLLWQLIWVPNYLLFRFGGRPQVCAAAEKADAD